MARKRIGPVTPWARRTYKPWIFTGELLPDRNPPEVNLQGEIILSILHPTREAGSEKAVIF
jgi:hypothetical protein